MRLITLVKNKVCLKLNVWVQVWFSVLLILLCLLFCLFSFWHWQKNSLFALDVAFLWCCSVKCRWRQEVIFYWEERRFFFHRVPLYSTVYMLVLTLGVYHLFPESCSSSTLKNIVIDTIWNVWYIKWPAMPWSWNCNAAFRILSGKNINKKDIIVVYIYRCTKKKYVRDADLWKTWLKLFFKKNTLL